MMGLRQAIYSSPAAVEITMVLHGLLYGAELLLLGPDPHLKVVRGVLPLGGRVLAPLLAALTLARLWGLYRGPRRLRRWVAYALTFIWVEVALVNALKLGLSHGTSGALLLALANGWVAWRLSVGREMEARHVALDTNAD